MSKRRWHIEHLLSAGADAGAAPTNAVALVSGEGGGYNAVGRNATGIAGGLFDFEDADFLTAIGMPTGLPIKLVECGGILGAQLTYSVEIQNKANTKIKTVASGTTAADFVQTDEFRIPPQGRVKFTTTGGVDAGGLVYIDVEEL